MWVTDWDIFRNQLNQFVLSGKPLIGQEKDSKDRSVNVNGIQVCVGIWLEVFI